MYQTLLIFAAFAFVYSITAGRLERTPFSGALAFAVFGALCGSRGLGWLDLDVSAEGVRALAEMTLALVLFTDAANADLSVLSKDIGLPRRLLLVGLPLTILLSAIVGAIIGGAALAMKGKESQTPIPFGPFLAAAGWISMLWGTDIMDAYLTFSGLR